MFLVFNFHGICVGQTTVGDSFNLGHLFCFCITAGYLPFDDETVQEQLKWIPEASHLISRLQNTNPDSRYNSINLSEMLSIMINCGEIN